jgi:hypothetical protein
MNDIRLTYVALVRNHTERDNLQDLVIDGNLNAVVYRFTRWNPGLLLHFSRSTS